MNYTIRKANQDDMSDVLSLIKELALFEKEPDTLIFFESNLFSSILFILWKIHEKHSEYKKTKLHM